MKKLNILCLLIFFLLTGCSEEKKPDNLLNTIKARNKIIVGIKDNSKPFGFVQNGKIKGFDADVAKNIAYGIFNSKSDTYIEFVPLKPSERISALNEARVDIVIATLSINDKRSAVIDFSHPYYMAGQALMVPSYSKISSIEQLNNKNVAVVLGTTGEKTIRMLAPNATSVGAINYKEAFELLQTQKVDAILADDSLLYGLIADNRGYKILKSRFTEEYYAVGIRKGEENLSLKKQINFTIEDMQQTGKLNRIKEKWIPKNIIK